MSVNTFDRKIKHLEFIQNVINRMNNNSFMMKGWAVTLVAALFALSDKDNNHHLYIIAFIPVPLFWLLDGFFLATERRFRDLYEVVSKKDEEDIDFCMNPYHNVTLITIIENENWFSCNRFKNVCKLTKAKIASWLVSTFSITLILFYGVMMEIMFVVKNILNG
jgi:hypothetical protein